MAVRWWCGMLVNLAKTPNLNLFRYVGKACSLDKINYSIIIVFKKKSVNHRQVLRGWKHDVSTLSTCKNVTTLV